MKIPSIRNIKFTINSCLQNLRIFSAGGNFADYPKLIKNLLLTRDTFYRSSYPELILHESVEPGDTFLYKTVLKKLKQFTHKDYDSLTKDEIRAIRANITVQTAQNAETIVNASKLVKKVFDKKYGEGNYVFISVGRSFAALAKCLEYMGNETRCIPFSGASNITEKTSVQKILHQSGFQKYLDFLNSEGLSPEQVKESHKYYLFCDYAQTGNSLTAFKRIVTDKSVGLQLHNVRFLKLNKILCNIADNLPDEFLFLNSRLMDMEWELISQGFDGYSSVKYLAYNHLGEIASAVNQPLETSAKNMQFCLLDILHADKSQRFVKK